MERASGKDLAAWTEAWLLTARLDTVGVEVETDGGVVTAARLHREALAAARRPAPSVRTAWTSPGSPTAPRCSG